MEEWTIAELAEKMAAGEVSALSLVEGYLERIDRLDKNGPAVNAVLDLNPDAREIAAALDAERVEMRPRGRLHGVPIMLKGNVDTADRMTSTAGSLALKGRVAAKDAFLVERLREAGAVILAKANLSEWANFRSTRSSSGWSSQGGQTRNPYALDRNPCGSSSGSAVAVAANFCAAAVGTETDGSIVCPSSVNGIVGIKPTVGLVSRSGVIPISHNQDTAGPMARTVADAAILLTAMVGKDVKDPASVSYRGSLEIDYADYLDTNGLKGARIGVARNYFGKNPDVDAIMERSIAVMREAGAEIVDPVELEAEDAVGDHELEVLYYDFKNDLNAFLGSLGADVPVHSLAELIDYNEAHKERVMPFFGQERLLAAQEKGSLTDDAYVEALAACRRLARAEGIDAVMTEHSLEAIVAPTGGPAWLTDLVNGDHFTLSSSTLPAVAGYPSITVPAGFVFGLPVGLSFFAGAQQEATLIKLAYAFEQLTMVRRPPQFQPTVVL